MKRLASLFATVLISLLAKNIAAADQAEIFGPYTALLRNADIIKDVKVEENGRIYLLLDPASKEKEIILKNSMAPKSGYRKWFNGEFELISPANQGKQPNAYTDFVTTSANYVEYYMDGELILHLGKTEIVSKQPPAGK
ncbi:MAG: hypothetical protein AAGB46_01155 [Verrucomicrobiota bacterium]